MTTQTATPPTDAKPLRDTKATQPAPAAEPPATGEPDAALPPLPLGPLLQDAASLLVQVLGADLASVAEVETDGGKRTLRQGFLVRGSSGELEALAADALPAPSEKPMAAYALEKSETVVTSNLASETRFDDPALLELEVVSGFCTPLKRNDQPFAVLGIYSKSPRRFGMADTLFTEAIGRQLTGVVRRLGNEYLRRNRPEEAQPHDGPTEELRSSPRAAYPYVQKIAPMYSGLIPSSDKFFPVRCRDLSAGGVAVYLSQPPDFESLVIQLGTGPSVRHYSAQVVRVELVEEDDQSFYLLGCRFTGRVYL